jgi:GH25 family lysozyme M1 (1,4-beta-N-acetylmuramidase)
MTSDYSRSTFNPHKHYHAVRMQQGRVQLDADWNEQVDITAYQLRQRSRDMLGPSGAPVDGAGFALEVEPAAHHGRQASGPRHHARLLIGAGRYYVDGLLCENEARVPWEEQPDDPGSEQPREPGVYLVMLDVWERAISAYEDPGIREVALGGPDTGVRTKTVWQVRALRVREDPDAADRGLLDDAWGRFLRRHARHGEMRARRRPGVATELPGNQLYRVEIQDEGERAGGPLEHPGAWPTLEVMPAPGEEAWLIARTKQLALHLWRPGRYVEVVAEHGRHLARLMKVNAGSGWLELSSPLPPELGTPRLLRPIASFKWSRNNGAEVLPVAAVLEPLERPQIRLGAPLGTRGVELRAGDLVEAVDAYTVLRGEPAPLRHILSVAEDRQGVTLDGEVPVGWGHDPKTRPLLRRWDHVPGAGASGPLPVESEWLELEHGVQVQFAGEGGYHPGDHWMMAARTRTGAVEWPQHEEAPLAQRPHGGYHQFCQLAVLRVDAHGRIEVEDRRVLFAPLGRGGAALSQPAGPVAFPDDVRVLGALRVDAELDAGSIRGQLAHETVGTHQLQEGAVTSKKLASGAVHLEHLAPEVGTVPAGFSLLGESPQPPHGYEPSHLSVEVSSHHARWEPRAPLPGGPAGRVVMVTLEQAGYALLDNGQVWRCDAQGHGWELISHLPQPQAGFTAAVLGHRIHVLGGRDARGRPLARHVAFEPPSKKSGGRWVTLSPLPTPRDMPGAVSTDGLLFILGGLECWPLPWWGGEDRLGRPAWLSWLERTSARVEVYEPAHDTWQVAREMPVPRSHFGVASLRGRLHVVGGQRKRLLLPARALARHEQFDPLTNRWAKLAPLERPRTELAAAAADERLWVMGGHHAGAILEDVERYSFTRDAWQPQELLLEPLRSPGAALLPGKLLVTGGTSPAGPRAGSQALEVAALLYVHRRRGVQALAAPTPSTAPPEAPEPSSMPLSTPDPQMAARSATRRRHFRTPRFEPALSPSQRLQRFGVVALALVAIAGSIGLVLRAPLSLAPPPPPLESLVGGIDISHHQGQVDWTTVLQKKPGFIFMKATEGESLHDPQFERNWGALKGSTIPRGAYHFYRPQDDPGAQARFFLSRVKLEASDLPPVLDVEVTDAKHSAQIIAGVKQWLEEVERATNRRPILYSYTEFWRDHLASGFRDYPLWLAGNRAAVETWAFWQRGDKGEVAGISGCVDEDVFRGSEEDLRRFIQTGRLPEHKAPPFPPLPGKCHRPTHSPEPPVPAKPPGTSLPPSTAGSPLPPVSPADAIPSEALPYQEGMAPHPPRMTHVGQPLIYTAQALEARISGMAIVLCTIQISGRVTDCTVVKSLPFLDEALKGMMTSRVYQPMSFHERPVAVRYPFYLNVQPPPGYER